VRTTESLSPLPELGQLEPLLGRAEGDEVGQLEPLLGWAEGDDDDE
jgi:hypothetical protein